jgi:hypothetical protein
VKTTRIGRVRRAREIALTNSAVRADLGIVDRIAVNSVIVYGCRGAFVQAVGRRNPTTLPRYMTTIRSEMCRTTARSWAMNA